MIVASSVLVAIALRRQGYRAACDRLVDAEGAGTGAPALVTAAMALRDEIGAAARMIFETLVRDLGVEVVAIDERHWPVAFDAYARFGAGRHPAGLSLDDCLTYAVARVANEPLLCFEEEFLQTDLERA
jgi:ribonuclease VapC